MIQTIVSATVLIIGGVFVLGTLLTLCKHPHWFIRGWDFPRVQIATILAACAILYAVVVREWRAFDWAVLLVFGGCVMWHLSTIVRYTRLWKPQVRQPKGRCHDRSLRLVVTNVCMENRDFDRWQTVILKAEPDIILAVEADEAWCDMLRRLQDDYPYGVFQPQDNMYGMAMISKLELLDPRIEFIVGLEYPSIHSEVRLLSGEVVELHGVHPPPPEPIRDKSARERDAELVIVGRDWIDPERPAIIAGDLNDVAWSHTTRLFQRLSGMLDPRIGRGFFNTWHANSRWFRCPLDHVFHSDDFRLIELRRLDHVGSDHFPMLVDLSYEPARDHAQPQPKEQRGDREEAQEKVEQQDEEGGVRARRDGRGVPGREG